MVESTMEKVAQAGDMDAADVHKLDREEAARSRTTNAMSDHTQRAREAAERIARKHVIINYGIAPEAQRVNFCERFEMCRDDTLSELLAVRQAALEEARAELSQWPTYGDYCDWLDRMIASHVPLTNAQEEPHG